MLGCFQQSAPVDAYDAVIILTDQGAYALEEDSDEALTFSRPIWFVHLGRPAFAYDDAVLDHIYRFGGGEVTDVVAALRGIRSAKQGMRDVAGYQWSAASPSPPQASSPRQMILGKARAQTLSNTVLDEMHRAAAAQSVVTPWSSMIVLVNDRQRKALEDASKEDERFDRQGHAGEEQLTQIGVSKIPEPSSATLWLTALLSLLGLCRLRRRRQPLMRENYSELRLI